MIPAATAVVGSSVATKLLNQGMGLMVKESWRHLHQYYADKFLGDQEVQKMNEELNSKLMVIQVPLDLCTRGTMAGQQGMEGARSVAISILKEIDDQQNEITEQQIKEGRGEAVLPPSECAKKLKRLAAKLDGLIPYLTLTLTAYQLPTSTGTNSTNPELGRLMHSSGLIQRAKLKCGKNDSMEVVRLGQGSLIKKGKRVWRTDLMECSFSLCMMHDTSQSGFPYSFVLQVEQDSSDGRSKGRYYMGINVGDITSISWSTLQDLNLGEGDLAPVLIVVTCPPKGSKQLPSADQNNSTTKGTVVECGIQCCLEDMAGAHRESAEATVAKEWRVLSEMEYVLRLACLEVKHQQCHTQVKESSIRSEFGDGEGVDSQCIEGGMKALEI